MRKPTVSKKDANHNVLVDTLLTIHGGQWIEYYNIGLPGHPDGLHVAPGLTIVGKFDPQHARSLLQDLAGVVRIFDGAKVHVEIKNSLADGQLTDEQREWMERYGPAIVIADFEDVKLYGK